MVAEVVSADPAVLRASVIDRPPAPALCLGKRSGGWGQGPRAESHREGARLPEPGRHSRLPPLLVGGGASLVAAGAWRWRRELEPGARMSRRSRTRTPWRASRAGATGTLRGPGEGTRSLWSAGGGPGREGRGGDSGGREAARPTGRSFWTFRPGVQSGCVSRVEPCAPLLLPRPGRGQSRPAVLAVSGTRYTVAAARRPSVLKLLLLENLSPSQSPIFSDHEPHRKGLEICWSEATGSPSVSSARSLASPCDSAATMWVPRAWIQPLFWAPFCLEFEPVYVLCPWQ